MRALFVLASTGVVSLAACRDPEPPALAPSLPPAPAAPGSSAAAPADSAPPAQPFVPAAIEGLDKPCRTGADCAKGLVCMQRSDGHRLLPGPGRCVLPGPQPGA